jgi:hypothetical protein
MLPGSGCAVPRPVQPHGFLPPAFALSARHPGLAGIRRIRRACRHPRHPLDVRRAHPRAQPRRPLARVRLVAHRSQRRGLAPPLPPDRRAAGACRRRRPRRGVEHARRRGHHQTFRRRRRLGLDRQRRHALPPAQTRPALRRAFCRRLGARRARGGHRTRAAQLPRHLLRGPARQLRRLPQDARAGHPRQTHHRFRLLARIASCSPACSTMPPLATSSSATPTPAPPSGSAKSTTSGAWANPAAPAGPGWTPRSPPTRFRSLPDVWLRSQGTRPRRRRRHHHHGGSRFSGRQHLVGLSNLHPRRRGHRSPTLSRKVSTPIGCG